MNYTDDDGSGQRLGSSMTKQPVPGNYCDAGLSSHLLLYYILSLYCLCSLEFRGPIHKEIQ